MENKTQQKKRTQLSIIIGDPVEKLNRSGINCIKYEHSSLNGHQSTSKSNQNFDRLFTAGRDSIIRVYSNLTPNNYSSSTTSASSINDNSPSNNNNNNNSSNIDKMYQMSLAHHTDWVNDIVVCKNTKTVFSASSDSTVKIWNSTKGTLLNTLRLHKDYVKCLAYAKDKQLLASAGFDKNIYIWDVSTGVSLNQSGLQSKNISENKYSIYSLAMNNQGSLLACGSPENCIRLWDPRTCTKIMKLKGHTHNVRAILLNKDGTQCLSASSDHTIRLWSLSQQRCISTFEIHSEGVWAMCVNDSFTKVYSGGKDNKVYCTDLRNYDDSVLLCEENAPILSLDFGYENESLWVATTNSSIRNWSLKSEKSNNNDNYSSSSFSSNINKNNNNNNNSPNTTTTTTSTKNIYLNEATNNIIDNNNKLNKSTSSSSSFMMQQPLNTQPLITIKGTTSVKQYTILNDKRYIVTKDSDENVCVWDVLQARKTETLGKENYENAIKIRQRFISIPNWFTVDLKLGVLTINLDENDWQSAWINFKDMDHNHVRHTQNCDLSDAKVNYGCIFLESLFKNCLFINPSQIQICNTVIVSSQQQQQQNSENNGKDDDKLQAGLLRFNIPEHVPIIFSEVAGRTLHRIEVRDLARDSEQHTLSNIMPLWIIDALHGKTIPKFNRIIFILNPYNQNQNKMINKDRLSSIDLLQVKKLKEHVYQKILKLDDASSNLNTQFVNNNFNNNESSSNIYSNSAYNQNSSQTNSSGINNGSSQLNNNSNEISNGANTTDLSANANRSIELICSDQILTDPEMNLRTIKHLIWKGSGDLTILFRVKQ